jgi:hypothetical protein
MKPWFYVLAGTLLLLGLQAVQLHAAGQGADERGRFEGIAAAPAAVWVIDTHSGRVRRCTQDFADQAPSCSALSN